MHRPVSSPRLRSKSGPSVSKLSECAVGVRSPIDRWVSRTGGTDESMPLPNFSASASVLALFHGWENIGFDMRAVIALDAAAMHILPIPG